MRLIKAVTRKLLHLIEYAVRLLRRHATILRALLKAQTLLRHLVRVFFTHGAPQ